MRYLLHAEISEEVVVQTPADIVVTAQIVEEHAVRIQLADLLDLLAQQADVARGEGVPYARHRRNVVEDMALGLFLGTEVGGDLRGLHDDLAQQQHRRAHDLADDAHHPDDVVHLRQIAAGGAELLPDIGHRVKADNVYTGVGEEQHIGGHIVEHHRVSVVQIPLVRIEGSHDDLAVVELSEVARGCPRENLRYGPLKGLGYLPVVVEEVVAAGVGVALTGSLCPLMLVAGVIHDKVKTAVDAALVTQGGQLAQVVHRAQMGLHLAEVSHGIAAVAVLFRAVQQRHEVKIVYAALGEIINIFDDAVEVAGEVIDIEHHADDIVAAIPVCILFAFAVTLF